MLLRKLKQQRLWSKQKSILLQSAKWCALVQWLKAKCTSPKPWIMTRLIKLLMTCSRCIKIIPSPTNRFSKYLRNYFQMYQQMLVQKSWIELQLRLFKTWNHLFTSIQIIWVFFWFLGNATYKDIKANSKNKSMCTIKTFWVRTQNAGKRLQK